MKTRIKILMAAVSIVAVSGIGGIAVANNFGGTPDNGTGPNSAPIPPGYSSINDPNLRSCMEAKQVCNPRALPELGSAPWASPLPSGAATMSRADAEQLARTAIHAINAAPVFSVMMSGSDVLQKFGVARSGNTDESRPVWIVTVVSPANTDGGPGVAPQTKGYYSAIVDAGSNQITDDCIGCDWLTVSK